MANEKDIYMDTNPNVLDISFAAPRHDCAVKQGVSFIVEANTTALSANTSFICKDIP
jgi:hypothetical protein